MTNPERPGEITFFRIFDGIRNQRKLVLVSLLSVACSIATISLGSFAWRSYSRAILIPVVFETASGDPVTVSANDAAGRPIAAFSAPAEEVLLPRSQVRLDVVASQRLGYRKSIDPSRRRQNQFTAPSDRLEDPQTHRWVLEDVLWYVNVDITRNGKSTNHCIVLRSDGLA